MTRALILLALLAACAPEPARTLVYISLEQAPDATPLTVCATHEALLSVQAAAAELADAAGHPLMVVTERELPGCVAAAMTDDLDGPAGAAWCDERGDCGVKVLRGLADHEHTAWVHELLCHTYLHTGEHIPGPDEGGWFSVCNAHDVGQGGVTADDLVQLFGREP